MMPTTHDFCWVKDDEGNIVADVCIEELRKVLKAGNQVLLTLKPSSKAVEKICEMAYPERLDAPDS